jgi:hypothetical protein
VIARKPGPKQCAPLRLDWDSKHYSLRTDKCTIMHCISILYMYKCQLS